MSDKVYKIIELAGSSPESIEDSVIKAVKQASKTVRKMSWFTIKEVRGVLDDENSVAKWQAIVRVGFEVED